MKLWTAFIVLFILTATSQAQIPFYPGYPDLQPYYPGATTQPYYPQAYYPQPFGAPYFSQDRYAADQLAISSSNEAIDSLTRQVQQLTEEVQSLQIELTAAQQQQVQTRAPEPQPSTEPATPVVLVLKNGRLLESQGYAIAGDTFWILTPSGSERIALSNINVPATQKENLKRGIKFPNLEN